MPMHAEIRSLVEAEFGPIPQNWWDDLVEEDYVGYAERDERTGMSRLKRRIRDLLELRAWAPGLPTLKTSPGASRLEPFMPESTKRGREEKTEARVMRVRPDIYSKYLAKMAGGSDAVRDFRDRYLSGRPLTVETAVAFLQSPAIRFLRESDFQGLGVPILGHESRVLEFKEGARDESTYVWTANLEINVPGRRVLFECECEVPTAPGKPPRRLPRLTIPVNPQQDATLAMFPSTVLDDLSRVTEEIMAEYPWEQPQAVWFALTGACPRVAPIEFRLERRDRKHHSRTLLTMTAEPWLPGDAVKYAYSVIQRRYLGRQRQPGPMNTEVFEFVIDRMSDGGEIPDWDVLVAAWNKDKSHKREYERWRFIRDFERARALIAFAGREVQPQPESEAISI